MIRARTDRAISTKRIFLFFFSFFFSNVHSSFWHGSSPCVTDTHTHTHTRARAYTRTHQSSIYREVHTRKRIRAYLFLFFLLFFVCGTQSAFLRNTNVFSEFSRRRAYESLARNTKKLTRLIFPGEGWRVVEEAGTLLAVFNNVFACRSEINNPEISPVPVGWQRNERRQCSLCFALDRRETDERPATVVASAQNFDI